MLRTFLLVTLILAALTITCSDDGDYAGTGPAPSVHNGSGKFVFEVNVQDHSGKPMKGLRVNAWDLIPGHQFDSATVPVNGDLNWEWPTWIRLGFAESAQYRLKIQNLDGRVVSLFQGTSEPGERIIQWTSVDLPATAYKAVLEVLDSGSTQGCFRDSIFIAVYDPPSSHFPLGYTDKDGVFRSSDSSVFPCLYSLPPMNITSPSGPEVLSNFNYSNHIVLVVTDTATGESMTDTVTINRGNHMHPNAGATVDFRWAPDRGHLQSPIENKATQVAATFNNTTRGDLNCNGAPNEMADLVMYGNYFIAGQRAFLNVNCAVAASDINADGVSLDVADLVYLVRVIVGDALPYPNGAVVPRVPIQVKLTVDGGVLSNASNYLLGGMYIVIAGNVTPELFATNMDLQYRYDGENTRILISPPTNRSFQGVSSGPIVDLRVPDSSIVSISAATVYGDPVLVNSKPVLYQLKQNYPNPF